MGNPIDDLGATVLAAHLTAAVRHTLDHDPPVGVTPIDEKLLFATLRSALAIAPRPGTAGYAQRLTFG